MFIRYNNTSKIYEYDTSAAQNGSGPWILLPIDFPNGIKEYGRTIQMGVWTTVPFSAANFTSDSGTWGVEAVDIVTQRYTIIGMTMIYMIYIPNTTVGATPNELRVALPTGFKVQYQFATPSVAADVGVQVSTVVLGLPGENFLRIRRLGGANWTTGINITAVYGIFTFEVYLG